MENPQQDQEKRVTWTELFFDLVFVFAVTMVSTLLRHDHSAGGILRALVVFVPMWWGWVGTSVHANTRDVDNALDRLGIFAVGLASLFMAMAVPAAYGARGALFGFSYLALRVLLAALVFRGPRLYPSPFSVGLLVTGPLVLLGGLVPDPRWRTAIWGLAGLIDLSTPALLRNRLAKLRIEPSHLPERFGLFVIIALGESVVGIGLNAASGADLSVARGLAVAFAFVLTCGLWWVYFVFAASAVRYAITSAAVRTDLIRQILTYGHLVFIAAIIAVAVGLDEAVSEPTHRLPPGVAGLLYGGTALYLAMFGYTRWRMFRSWAIPRLTAAAVTVALVPAALHLPAVAALALIAAVVAVLNTVEFTNVRRAEARSSEEYLTRGTAVELAE